MSSPPIAAIEIGTTRTVLAVGETQPNGRVRVLGTADVLSSGVRKSRITDISQASAAVENVLKKIVFNAKTNVNVAMLVVNGQHIQSTVSQGVWRPAGKSVTEEDIAEVRDAAQTVAQTQVNADQHEILQIFDLDYTVNDTDGISNPVGMNVQTSLSHRVLTVFADKDSVANSDTAASDAHLEIQEPVFAGYAAARATLTKRDMDDGVIVIDLGGGCTSYVVYCDGRFADAGVLGVGGDHVTNDIAYAFNCTNGQAEQLKRDFGSAEIDPSNAASRIPVPRTVAGAEDRSISMRALHTVINVRLAELFRIILSRLEEKGLQHRLGAGAVLTGGGAYLRNADRLAGRVLGLQSRVGALVNIDGLDQAPNPASFACIAGALIYGAEIEDQNGSGGGLGGFFRRIFK